MAKPTTTKATTTGSGQKESGTPPTGLAPSADVSLDDYMLIILTELSDLKELLSALVATTSSQSSAGKVESILTSLKSGDGSDNLPNKDYLRSRAVMYRCGCVVWNIQAPNLCAKHGQWIVFDGEPDQLKEVIKRAQDNTTDTA